MVQRAIGDGFALDGSKFPCRRKLVQSSCEMGTILIPISKCFNLRGLEVMMHTCIHCLCWRAKASTNHKPPKATSVRLFQLSSVDNSPGHFFGANSSALSPSPLCSACLWIFSRTHVAEALVASDILNLLMFRSVFKLCYTATGMEWSLIRTTSQIFAWLRSVREQNMQKPTSCTSH